MKALFFFSSRRRHTRFDCDWSSDVCSSDLGLFRFFRRIALNIGPLPKNQPACARADEKDRSKRFEVTGSSRWRSLQGFRVAKEIEVTSDCGAKIARLLKSEI